MIRKGIVPAAVLYVMAAVSGCGRDEGRSPHGVNVVENAELLAIYERDGYDEVHIVNTRGEEVAHYVLVDSDSISGLPEGAEVIYVPLMSVVPDSEVYAGGLEEIGSGALIKGIFDAAYVTSPSLMARIDSGEVADFGPTSSPNAEKIVKMNPGALLISYFDGMQTQGLDKLGIPVVKMYDLQEPTPLGRAEWIKFLGRLTGRGEMADSLYEEVKNAYTQLKAPRQNGPKVLTEIMYEGSWNVAGGNSYQASFIRDAGGRYFKAGDESPVTLALTPEQVLMEGGDADIWLIRYFGDGESLKGILGSDPVYGEFKAYKDGNIYFSDTSESGLFREFPFHPERLLQDYRIIFSGDSVSPLRYFRKL